MGYQQSGSRPEFLIHGANFLPEVIPTPEEVEEIVQEVQTYWWAVNLQ
ncbi:hypothetical protein [Moorella sulfitireducens (nom. illeg.)]|nr:hypothetical protein [Moorella sulfitireducens]